jgi:hypothetical protein
MLGLMLELTASQWGLVDAVKYLLCFGLPLDWCMCVFLDHVGHRKETVLTVKCSSMLKFFRWSPISIVSFTMRFTYPVDLCRMDVLLKSVLCPFQIYVPSHQTSLTGPNRCISYVYTLFLSIYRSVPHKLHRIPNAHSLHSQTWGPVCLSAVSAFGRFSSWNLNGLGVLFGEQPANF